MKNGSGTDLMFEKPLSRFVLHIHVKCTKRRVWEEKVWELHSHWFPLKKAMLLKHKIFFQS